MDTNKNYSKNRNCSSPRDCNSKMDLKDTDTMISKKIKKEEEDSFEQEFVQIAFILSTIVLIVLFLYVCIKVIREKLQRIKQMEEKLQ